MKTCVLLLILSTFALQAEEQPDKELIRLQQILDAAPDQGATNAASRELARYWDGLLIKEEAKVLSSCDAEAAELFKTAQKTWRAFRDAETERRGDLYRGGSIRPQMANNAFIRITKQRLQDLQRSPELMD